MILYAETSAVLSWLFGEPDGTTVGPELASAGAVVASDLTWLECHRSITRLIANGRLKERDAGSLRVLLTRSSARWTRLAIDQPVLERAKQSFPNEPLPALDAIHLASALLTQTGQPDTAILTLDKRIRQAAAGLGLPALPDGGR